MSCTLVSRLTWFDACRRTGFQAVRDTMQSCPTRHSKVGLNDRARLGEGEAPAEPAVRQEPHPPFPRIVLGHVGRNEVNWRPEELADYEKRFSSRPNYRR